MSEGLVRVIITDDGANGASVERAAKDTLPLGIEGRLILRAANVKYVLSREAEILISKGRKLKNGETLIEG